MSSQCHYVTTLNSSVILVFRTKHRGEVNTFEEGVSTRLSVIAPCIYELYEALTFGLPIVVVSRYYVLQVLY